MIKCIKKIGDEEYQPMANITKFLSSNEFLLVSPKHPCNSLSRVLASSKHPCNKLAGVPAKAKHPCSSLAGNY
jgi:hypothetical protein